MKNSVEINKSSSTCLAVKKKGFAYNISRNKIAYLLMLPAIILTIFMSYLPYTGLIMAFKDFNIIKGVFGSPWVGFDNFKYIFSQPNMLLAIKNSFVYGMVIQFCGMPFPVVLALLFNEIKNMKFKKVVQTVSYMPHFLSWIAIIGMFSTIFSLEGPYNQLMSMIIGEGYKAKNILYDANNFLPIIFFTHIWKNIGWSSIIFLAAITGIDQSLYEAATVDGCGKFKQIIHITLPGIRNTILVVFVMSLGSLFSTNFEQVYGFQNVYIQQQTETINTLIYRLGIQNGKYSLATAFGLAQGVVAITLTVISNIFSKKMFEVSIW